MCSLARTNGVREITFLERKATPARQVLQTGTLIQGRTAFTLNEPEVHRVFAVCQVLLSCDHACGIPLYPAGFLFASAHLMPEMRGIDKIADAGKFKLRHYPVSCSAFNRIASICSILWITSCGFIADKTSHELRFCFGGHMRGKVMEVA